MELTNKQNDGLKLAVSRYLAGERYTVIGGYAGSGKSTLVKFIVDALLNTGIEPYEISYCAFTGKAAQVLTNKGCPAVTMHKLLYKARPKPDGRFVYYPNLVLDYKVVIVDECSMAPAKMVELLLAHKEVYVIFCGDPGQLPPITKSEDNHLLDHPHIFLDEIMRQAQDSGIIRLSMAIRNGDSISGFTSGDALVLPKSKLNTGMLQWADQILCATNATRKDINAQCRDLRGYIDPVESGEKIIACRNYWDTISENGNALTNGCIGSLTGIFPNFYKYPMMFHVKDNIIDLVSGTFITETGDNFGILDLDKLQLTTGEPSLSPQQKYQIGRSEKYGDNIPLEFDYGYAITCHRAQGSEWGKVLVLEENFPFAKEEHKRWLYTAVTRSSEKCVLVR